MNHKSFGVMVLSLIAALGSVPALGSDTLIPKKVTDLEAMDLVFAALYRHRPGEIDPYSHPATEPNLDVTTPKRDAPFYAVESLGQKAGTVGWYAVNPWTGDVWDYWSCNRVKRLTSPLLRRRQAEIKTRFSKQELQDYDRLRDLDPGCLLD